MRGGSRVPWRGRPSTAGNAAISLIGAIAPALVALVTIPMLVRVLGAEVFGLLSFVWIVFFVVMAVFIKNSPTSVAHSTRDKVIGHVARAIYDDIQLRSAR